MTEAAQEVRRIDKTRAIRNVAEALQDISEGIAEVRAALYCSEWRGPTRQPKRYLRKPHQDKLGDVLNYDLNPARSYLRDHVVYSETLEPVEKLLLRAAKRIRVVLDAHSAEHPTGSHVTWLLDAALASIARAQGRRES